MISNTLFWKVPLPPGDPWPGSCHGQAGEAGKMVTAILTHGTGWRAEEVGREQKSAMSPVGKDSQLTTNPLILALSLKE